MRGPINWLKAIRQRWDQNYVQRDLNQIIVEAKYLKSTSIDDLAEQVAWAKNLMDWIRLPVNPENKKTTHALQASRLRFLVQYLDRNTQDKESVQDVLQSMLVNLKARQLFCQTGMAQELGFLKEVKTRLLTRFLPVYRDPHDLFVLFSEIFHYTEDADWIELLDDDLFEAITHLLLSDESARQTFRAKIQDAVEDSIRILVSQISAVGFSTSIQERLGRPTVERSPFFKILNEIIYSSSPTESMALKNVGLLKSIRECQKDIQTVYLSLEDTGVSVELVFQLERISRMLNRVERLLDLREGSSSREKIRFFIADLIRSEVEAQSVNKILGKNLNLISKKVVERTGETGDHYIVRNRKEFREMFASAAGGGLMTVLTTLLKSAIAGLKLPLFLEGILAWLNYSLSFLAMQFMHLTLATKTPAMTASALAIKLKGVSPGKVLPPEFIAEAKGILRGGFVAALGNVWLVTFGAIVVDTVYFLIRDSHIFSESYALHNFEQHSPISSLTIFYAMQTGLLLWLGATAGGWIENWFVLHRVRENLLTSKFLKVLLSKGAHDRFVNKLRANIGTLGTNISLGFLLAFAGIIGRFFGLPFDVRHITLSSGTLAFSTMAVTGTDVSLSQILWGWSGIIVIGIMNFGVSFSFSLFIAARARNLDLKQFAFVLRDILSEFRKAPREFLLPPKEN